MPQLLGQGALGLVLEHAQPCAPTLQSQTCGVGLRVAAAADRCPTSCGIKHRALGVG